jgi:diacylglycerol kinase family enzyme
MRYVFLNPSSCAGKAPLKWKKVAKEFADAQVIEDSHRFDWKQHTFQKDDILISAGGDGTLHNLVNTLVRLHGLEFLKNIKIGHVGLGSNNSFLRPYSECQKVHGIPMRVSEDSLVQDLIEVEIVGPKGKQIIYCVANASLGFLAKANQVFNTSETVYELKKINSDLADFATFFKTLGRWRSKEIRFETAAGVRNERITNMHFMKRPFYAADMGFPEQIPPSSGTFSFNLLKDLSKGELARRFASVLIFKKFEKGRHEHADIPWIRIESANEIPFEMDGEVHWGRQFNIHCVQGGVRLCR